MNSEEIKKEPWRFLNNLPKNVTKEQWSALLEGKPHLLKMLKEQDSELCKIAVSKNPNTLCLVHNQTEEIVLTAIENDTVGIALCYVRQQTEKIVKAALAKNKDSKYYVDAKFRYLVA